MSLSSRCLVLFHLKKAWKSIFFINFAKTKSTMSAEKKNSISKYIEEITDRPLLSDEQERLLAQRINEGDTTAISELVESNLRFVLSIANQYKGNDVSYDDLVSEGNIGLMRAASRFSPYPGKRFVSFAAPIVRDSIEQFIEKHSGLYKIPQGEKSQAESRRSHPASIDAPIPAGSKNNFNLLNLIENTSASYADKQITKEDIEHRIQSIFTQLNERERRVMSLIYGVGSDRHTMVEVGAIMNLNRERVRQIRDKALRKLRKARRQFDDIS